ncbi:inositol monophosphatase family protein [Pokkaliibacter sp. CJK22405]|uniref:inositol monophosphatase family protein n=1 Tax=Pokkaliibacter sp. CJK22405 TaxID=3384615 RepID=UPI003984A819
MQPMLNIAIRAARIASENLVRAIERLDVIRAEGQDVNKFIRETCQRAEQSIARSLQKAYPNHSVTGSVGGQAGEAVAEPEASWTVNALNGELNYSRGLPSFTLSMVAHIRGKAEHMLIIHPMSSDEYTASRGRGAQLNGRRIRLSNKAQLDGAMVSLSFDNTISNRHLLSTYMNAQRQLMMCNTHLHQTGSALLDMASVAAGQVDAGIFFAQTDLELDAGTLLLQEAGALLGDISGNPSYRQNGHVLAGNAKLFKALIQQLQSVSGDLS